VTDEVYFLTVEEVVLIHADQISRYGGDSGRRDTGLLESAVHAAENVAAYANESDLCDMAAAYMFHIAENQPFVDGNNAQPWPAHSSSSIRTASRSWTQAKCSTT
jgi:death on curing protein